MNSVLYGLSCNLRQAYEFARSVTQDERRVTRDEAADTGLILYVIAVNNNGDIFK